MVLQADSITRHAHQLKQPKGIFVLSFAEIWERFGFYVVQALLVRYLVHVRGFDDNHAYSLTSAFSALIYTTPIIGGILADRLLGYRRAIVLGTVLYIAGYLGLLLDGTASSWIASHTKGYVSEYTCFLAALALLVAGNGFFKSCVSSLLGTLYEENDPRRDSGFTLFYIGINIGSFLGPIAASYALRHFGYGYGFGTAFVGMLICLLNCWLGFKQLNQHGLAPRPELLKRRILPLFSLEWLVYLAVIIGLVPIILLLNHTHLVEAGLLVFGAIVAILMFVGGFFYEKKMRSRLWVLLILMAFSTVFWALYMQVYLTIILFIDRVVDRHIFGYELPVSIFPGFIGLFIIVLSPLFILLWSHLSAAGKDLSRATKFALAILLMGLAFLSLKFSTFFPEANGAVSLFWVVLCLILFTCGELCLSPIGLSMVTDLAPPKLSGALIGVWFLILAIAYDLAGILAKTAVIPAGLTNKAAIAEIYSTQFGLFAYGALAIAVVLFILTPWLKRMLK